MKKVFAEVIAGLIPHKMTRNRWRGILRFGIFNAIKLRNDLKRNTTEPSVGLAVCAIAKDEGDYFKEWIDWHIAMGVERFYIYDNGSTDNTREILEPYIQSGVVEYIPFPGYRMQLAAYDDCLLRHRYDTRWIAFIDLDEFIVPQKNSTIPEFLREIEEAAAVEINWLIYGSSMLTEKDNRPVMERFVRHSLPSHLLNRHVKSIVNPRKVYGMIGCHEVACIHGHATDSHGTEVRRNFKEREPQHDVIRINHYAVKSRQEFIEKQNRGRASGTQRTVPDEYFTKFDLNDIADERSGMPEEVTPRKQNNGDR